MIVVFGLRLTSRTKVMHILLFAQHQGTLSPFTNDLQASRFPTKPMRRLRIPCRACSRGITSLRLVSRHFGERASRRTLSSYWFIPPFMTLRTSRRYSRRKSLLLAHCKSRPLVSRITLSPLLIPPLSSPRLSALSIVFCLVRAV